MKQQDQLLVQSVFYETTGRPQQGGSMEGEAAEDEARGAESKKSGEEESKIQRLTITSQYWERFRQAAPSDS